MKYAPILAAILLAGCAPTLERINARETQIADDVAALKEFTITDFENALDIAETHNDVLGVKCWASLVKVLDETDITIHPATGAAAAYEKLRVARLTLERGAPDDVRIWCGAMVNDSKQSLADIFSKLGLKLGGL